MFQYAINNALEFRYRVIEPFLLALEKDDKDGVVELLTTLRRKIDNYEETTAERGFLDANNITSILPSPTDKKSLLGLFEQYAEARQSLFIAIGKQNVGGVRSELENLQNQNIKFLDMLLASYRDAISRI